MGGTAPGAAAWGTYASGPGALTALTGFWLNLGATSNTSHAMTTQPMMTMRRDLRNSLVAHVGGWYSGGNGALVVILVRRPYSAHDAQFLDAPLFIISKGAANSIRSSFSFLHMSMTWITSCHGTSGVASISTGNSDFPAFL